VPHIVRRGLLIAVAALVLALPGTALARRGLAGAAKDPLVHAALGAQAPRQCAAVYISTVNRLWAAVFYKPAQGWGARCKSVQRSWTALHHARGRWRVQGRAGEACVALNMPAAIRHDLQLSCYPLLP
jgi:hypothetical protein